jgi:hypothetical protein
LHAYGDSSGSIEDHFRDSWSRVKSDIDSTDDSMLLNTDTDELVNYYYEKYSLPTIEIDTSRQDKLEKNGTSASRDQSITIGIPIVLKSDLDVVISRTANPHLMTVHFELDGGYLSSKIDLYGGQLGKSHIEQTKNTLKTVIQQKNDTVNSQNPKFKKTIENYIKPLKEKIRAENVHLEQIANESSVELIKNDTAPSPVNLKVKQKIQIVKPEPKKTTDPALQRESVNAVLELISNQGRQFETTPKVFSGLREEDLRDIILSMLNAVFEGSATGETFVKKGKTDIHLQINIDGGILTAECKFWGGEKLYGETIDQHFGYLTWRQNYAIQITFSKNQGFSEVIGKAIESTKSHPTYVHNSFRQISDSHFVTTNTFPEDASKSVEIHHLLFNIYY